MTESTFKSQRAPFSFQIPSSPNVFNPLSFTEVNVLQCKQKPILCPAWFQPLWVLSSKRAAKLGGHLIATPTCLPQPPWFAVDAAWSNLHEKFSLGNFSAIAKTISPPSPTAHPASPSSMVGGKEAKRKHFGWIKSFFTKWVALGIYMLPICSNGHSEVNLVPPPLLERTTKLTRSTTCC